MPDEPAIPNECLACSNTFELLPNPDKPVRHCPFCHSEVWPDKATELMSSFAGFNNLRLNGRQLKSAVFEATRGGRKYWLTFLEEGSGAYRNEFQNRFDRPNDLDALLRRRNPDTLQIYPVFWFGDTAVLIADRFEGASLHHWLEQIDSLSIGDAIRIVLACLESMSHLRIGNSPSSTFGLTTIFVSTDSQIRINSGQRNMGDLLFRDPLSLINSRSLVERRLERRKRSKRFSSGLFLAGFQDAASLSSANEVARSGILFRIGCLFYELLMQKSSLFLQQFSVDEFEVSKSLEARGANPLLISDLLTCLRRLLDQVPSNRVNAEGYLIAKLEKHITSRDLDFVKQDLDVTTDVAQPHNYRWLHRRQGFDLRNVRWGMTRQQVLAAEGDDPAMTTPLTATYITLYRHIPFEIEYHFEPADDPTAARLRKAVLAIDRRHYIHSESNAHAIAVESEELNQRIDRTMAKYYREGRDEEAQLIGLEFSEYVVKRFGGSGSGGLSTSKEQIANENFEVVADLITQDFGEPVSREGQPFEIPEVFTTVAASRVSPPAGSSIPAPVEQSLVWKNESTIVCLKMTSPGLSDLKATFVCRKHVT